MPLDLETAMGRKVLGRAEGRKRAIAAVPVAPPSRDGAG
jgi:hypothetical protein